MVPTRITDRGIATTLEHKEIEPATLRITQPAPATGLPKAGNSGLSRKKSDRVSTVIFVDLRQCDRPWAHQRELPADNLPELR
jgi:hypothetical protein